MDLPADTTHNNTTFRRYYKRFMPDLKKTKNRQLTATIFSFLAVSLFAWFAVKPTAQTIIYLKKEIEDKTVLNQKMEDKITALIEAQATYEKLQNRLYVLDQALPHTPDGAIIARQLANFIHSTGASISALQVGAQLLSPAVATGGSNLTGKPVDSYTISLVINSSYQSLRSFVTGLLNFRRITTMDALSIRPIESQANGESKLESIIRLQSYFTNL